MSLFEWLTPPTHWILILLGSMVLILLAARWLPLLRGGKETGRREVEILEQRVRERTEELERNREALVESQRIAHFGNWD